MWTVQGIPTRSLDSELQPEKVLIYYDGPRSFTATLGGRLYLIHWCDEDSECARYLASPIDEESLAALESGAVTLREALTTGQSKILILDVAHANNEVLRGWLTSWNAVPEHVKPAEDARMPSSR